MNVSESSIQKSIDTQCATALEFLKVLRSSVDDGSIRVVTWFMQAPKLLSYWIDVLGVGLQVPASFFMALLPKIKSQSLSPWMDAYPEVPINRFAYPQHLVIGNAVATLLHTNGSDVPTVFIAYSEDRKMPDNVEKTRELLELDAARRVTLEPPNVSGLPNISAHYQRLLREYMDQELPANSIFSAQDLFFISLLPLFKMASMSVQSMHDSVERSLSQLNDENREPDKGARDERSNHLRNETYKRLDQERYQLRRTTEDCENHQDFFVDYVVSNGHQDWLQRRSYRTTAAYWALTTKVAKRLEAEVRDYMQLVVGDLSIEESRKSIQLSNTQLDESKKGSSSITEERFPC
ncbi:MAG: hypothetical protein Q9208_001915 [Pyrenodesmia sp. 3 TL-2023]